MGVDSWVDVAPGVVWMPRTRTLSLWPGRMAPAMGGDPPGDIGGTLMMAEAGYRTFKSLYPDTTVEKLLVLTHEYNPCVNCARSSNVANYPIDCKHGGTK